MKIESFRLQSLHNEEHYQFHSEVKELVERFTPEALKITNQYSAYPGLYSNEGEALNLTRKSALTQQIADTDAVRDQTYQGLAYTVTGALNHFDDNVKAAAQRLSVLFEHYGNVPKKAYDDESAAITSLIADLRGTYASDMATAGLTGWTDKLDADNKAFIALTTDRYSEEANRTSWQMKTVRTQIDDAYRNLTNYLGALITIEGGDAYSGFVNELNSRVEKYKLILAQRQGRNAKAAAKEAAAATTTSK